MRLHEREIMRFLMRSAASREDALDLFQETWLRAYRAYPKLRSFDDVRAWLFRIAVNLCHNHRRARWRESRVVADWASPAHVSGEGNWGESAGIAGSRDGAQGPAEPVVAFRQAIRRLPEGQRAALVMRKLNGLGYAEIGRVLGCSPQSARARVYEAMKKLRVFEVTR